MKSIRMKLIVVTGSIFAIALIAMGIITAWLSYKGSIQMLDQLMTETAEIAAERVEQELEVTKQIAYEIGSIARLSDETRSREDKLEILQQRMQTHGYVETSIVVDGIDITDGLSYSDREWYREAMAGNTYVSDPIVSRSTGKVSVIVSAPLWKGGLPNTEVVGCVYITPHEDFLNNIVESIQIGENGYTYLLNKHGTVVAHEDRTLVSSETNYQEMSKTQPEYRERAAIEARMIAGEQSFGQYIGGDGTKRAIAFAPVGGTDGWSVGIVADRSEMTQSTQHTIEMTVIVVVFDLIVGLFIVAWFATKIAKPIKACADRMGLLSHGDLHTPVPTTDARDETGYLLESVSVMTDGLTAVVNDMSSLLGSMSQGDFTVHSACPDQYVGDFESLHSSIGKMCREISRTLVEIDQASDQVSLGASQVSSGAQALAQGSTEQAASVEELAASMGEITSQVETTAEHAKTAGAANSRSHELIDACSEHMGNLVEAMAVIEDTSEQISRVIKTIEDIAKQTNILSINASVEAARAGEAGKGFAVVAEEVRNLATKSSDASKDTGDLIAQSVEAVRQGTLLSRQTSEALQAVVVAAGEVYDAVEDISKACVDQAEAVEQVKLGVDQISDVVQTNSATSEESAAASEELSSQSRVLKSQVSCFKIRMTD